MSKSLPASSETWRSDTLVKILVMFWIEGYAGEDALNDANSPTVVSQGSASSLSDYVSGKVGKILKGSLDLIPSVKIQIMGGKVCLRCKGKTFWALPTKSLLTSSSNVLPY